MSTRVVVANDDSFYSEAIESDKPVVVDFWAPWCGPCRGIGPVIDELAKENDSIKVVKVNIDEAPKTAASLMIMSVPTIAKFENGKLVGKVVGAIPKHRLRDQLRIA